MIGSFQEVLQRNLAGRKGTPWFLFLLHPVGLLQACAPWVTRQCVFTLAEAVTSMPAAQSGLKFFQPSHNQLHGVSFSQIQTLINSVPYCWRSGFLVQEMLKLGNANTSCAHPGLSISHLVKLLKLGGAVLCLFLLTEGVCCSLQLLQSYFRYYFLTFQLTS